MLSFQRLDPLGRVVAMLTKMSAKSPKIGRPSGENLHVAVADNLHVSVNVALEPSDQVRPALSLPGIDKSNIGWVRSPAVTSMQLSGVTTSRSRRRMRQPLWRVAALAPSATLALNVIARVVRGQREQDARK
jgi:hypothetical protein